VSSEPHTPDWTAAAARIQDELRAVREAFDADWAVLWGPLPLPRGAPFASVLFEDRPDQLSTAIGLAVPLLGNAWAECLFAAGGAVSDDPARDARLALYIPLIQRKRIAAIASGAYVLGGVVQCVTEVYSTRPLRLPTDPIARLARAGRAIAEVLAGVPRPTSSNPPAPSNDPLTAAALHDLRNALAAQSLLVRGIEKDMRALSTGERPASGGLGGVLDSLAVLRDSVQHASELARVMTLGTLAPGERVNVGIADVISLALAAVSADLRERFAVEIAPGLEDAGPVLDAPALLRALVNLVQNAALAIQRRPAARAAVRVRAEGGDVLIEVEDEGPGVPAEVLDHLFEPGVTTRERRDGHGYGLYSARQTLEQLGGALTLYSEPRHGARFTMRLPRAVFSL